MSRVKIYILSLLLLSSCNRGDNALVEQRTVTKIDSVPTSVAAPETLQYTHPEAAQINTEAINPEDIVAFAQTLKGTPYRYASCDRSGFDCSGFVYYVFNHFNINVPRSSVDYPNIGKEIKPSEARAGDIILFTGTDSSRRTVGHIGIITTNLNDSVQFIHSSSGKANGVTLTPLDNYYQGRLMKVIRVFKQNEEQ
jgi:cell wall-associated NlpC family hydrolase